MSDPKQPRRWVEFVLEPSTGTATTYRWATRPLAGTFFVDGRITADGWENITRRASSASGEYAVDSASIIINDADGLVRSLLADTTTQWFVNREAAFNLLSEAAFTAGLTPRILFGGRCFDVQVQDGRKARLEFEDVLAPYLDRTYPQYTLGDAYPYRVTEAAAWGAGPAWAFLETTANFANGETVTIGATVYTFGGGGVTIGADMYASRDNLVAAIASHPDVSAVNRYNETGEGRVDAVKVTALVAGTAGNSIAVSTTAANARWFNEGGGDCSTLLHGSDEVGDDFDVIDPQVQIPTALRDQVMPIYYGPHIDSAVDPISGVQRSKGLCPVFFMGYTQLEGGTGTVPEEPGTELAGVLAFHEGEWGGWGELFVCLGEVDIPNVYVSDLAETPTRIRLDSSRYGVDVKAPGHTGWDLGSNFVMRNGFKCTVIHARGPILWHHIAGLVNITVDLCGWKNDDGDSIDQAGYAYQSFISEHVLAHDGDGFTSGPEAGLPLFADGRSMIWTSRVEAWQELTATRLGTTKGYLCSIAMTEPMTLREWLRIWHVTFDAFSAKNAAGQLYPFSIDDLADPTAGVAIRERTELTGLPAPRIAWDEIENQITYTVGYDPEQKTPRTTPLTITNWDAINALKDKKKFRNPGTRDLRFTADDATAADAMGRRLLRLSEPPRYQPLPVRTDGVDREIGEQVRVSHQDGIGAVGVGYNLEPMVLMGHQHRGNSITLEALDISRILETAIGAPVDGGGGGWGWGLWP